MKKKKWEGGREVGRKIVREKRGRQDINMHIESYFYTTRAGFPVFHPHVSLRGFDSPSGWSCVEGREEREGGYTGRGNQNAGVVSAIQ